MELGTHLDAQSAIGVSFMHACSVRVSVSVRGEREMEWVEVSRKARESTKLEYNKSEKEKT